MAILKNTTISNTGAVSIPSGTTAQRPIAIYSTAGTYSWSVPAGVTSVKVLVVGGGGAGGGDVGGGGAGGRVIYNASVTVVPGTSVSVTVGAGGARSSVYNGAGLTGGTSIFAVPSGTTITAIGGNGGNGRSGAGALMTAANTGWNGGGSSYDTASGTAGSSGTANNAYSSTSQPTWTLAGTNGFAGGNGGTTGTGTLGSGGGAGAAGPGFDGNTVKAGNGGWGVWSSISGAPEVFAGGGGGSYYSSVEYWQAGKGAHGGGDGGLTGSYQTGGDGRSGYGCGGGGANSTGSFICGLGGAGCVIINWATTGSIRFNTTFNEMEVWDGTRYVNPITGYISGLGKSERTAAGSAAQIKEAYPDSTSGTYWISPDHWIGKPFLVYCDMITDGGGWMMVAHANTLLAGAGSYTGRKSNTARSNSYYLPLFHIHGTQIVSDSKTSGVAFSRPDFMRAVAGASDYSHCMARRTGNQNNIMIWNISDLSRFGRVDSQYTTFGGVPGVSIRTYFKLSNTGANPWSLIDRLASNRTSNNITGQNNAVRYETGPSYPGIAWNSSSEDNSDGTGSFISFLNRRSLLYWDTNDGAGTGYTDNQWFHATPMEMGPSSGPSNSRTDVEFYFRERKPANDPMRLMPSTAIGMTSANPALHASQILRLYPNAPSGLYWIKPTGYAGAAQQVFCDMVNDGGGWMMVSSNNARDTTIPSGTSRQSQTYELDNNGGTGVTGSFGISPNGDYIIGTIINTLAFEQVRVWGWGYADTSGQYVWGHAAEGRPGRMGTDVKALWQLTTTGASRLTEVVARAQVGIYCAVGVSSSAAYFVLDANKVDRINGGYTANANQCTIGGAGVTGASGDPTTGCYLGHGTSEGAYEGWYNAANGASDCQGYTTWVRTLL